jgi:hypothetical protein
MRTLATTLALLALAGCGDDGGGDVPRATVTPTPPADGLACTEIGCNDIAQVEFARAPRGRVEVRMCVEDQCQTSVSRGRPPVALGIPLPESPADRVRVTVTMRRNGRTVARAEEQIPVRTTRPNGPDCPPVCRVANARLDVALGTLEPV